jgi:hypothetical protein
VERYRSQINNSISFPKTLNIVKYALDLGIIDDAALNKKFAEELARKKGINKL